MYAVLLLLLTFYLSIDTGEIAIASGEGKNPIALLVMSPSTVQCVYIFTHTTVQDFLDIVDARYDYIYEGEIINEIPKWYFMVTLGLQGGSMITRQIPKQEEENSRDDEEYIDETFQPEYRV